MAEYRVGEPYIPGRTRWPEGVDFNYRSGALELRLFFSRLGDRDVRDIRQRECEFALYVEQPLIVLLYRFGQAVPWSDAPFTIGLVPLKQRTLPTLDLGPECRPHACGGGPGWTFELSGPVGCTIRHESVVLTLAELQRALEVAEAMQRVTA